MRTYKIKYYKSGFFRPKWRWNITADNGNIIGASTQGYFNKQDCVSNAILLGHSLVAQEEVK